MGPGFRIGWSIFRILVWVTIAVWVQPQWLELVGGHDISEWLRHHTWVRWLGAPPLFVLAVISAFELLDDPKQRAARQDVASSTGGTLVDLHRIDPTYGIPDGPGLRVPLGRWSVLVGTWKSQGDAHTVARVQVDVRSEFSFVARGTDREPAMMRGLQQFAVGVAMRQAAERTGDSRVAAAAAALAYMSGPPLETGNDVLDRTVVLRANQPDTASALLNSSTVAYEISELNAKTRRWDWTLHPTATAGVAEMTLECPGALKDPETLRIVQALLRAALEHLAEAGVVTR